jgi:L-amino acid N-acyltransferase YncA
MFAGIRRSSATSFSYWNTIVVHAALYRRMGFTPVGVYHEQGKLDGRWVDVLIMELLL